MKNSLRYPLLACLACHLIWWWEGWCDGSDGVGWSVTPVSQALSRDGDGPSADNHHIATINWLCNSFQLDHLICLNGVGGGLWWCGGDGGVTCVSVNGTKKHNNTKLLMRGEITTSTSTSTLPTPCQVQLTLQCYKYPVFSLAPPGCPLAHNL